MWFNMFIIIYLGSSCESMLVKSWGTSVKINWLRWSVYDIFNEALEQMTLGFKGVYPVQGFTKHFNKSDGKMVHFEAYNGWLEDLQLENLNSPGAELRRVRMTRAERYLHEKAAGIKEKDKNKETGHEKDQHEMIICLDCMALSITRLHYAYRAEMNSTDESTTEPLLLWTAGTLENLQPLTIPITFQMSIMVSQLQNKETLNNTDQAKRKQCVILLEPLQLSTWKKWPTIATKVGRFSFLADHIDQSLEVNFNNSTLQELRSALDTSVRRTLHTRNICLEILLKDSDYPHE